MIQSVHAYPIEDVIKKDASFYYLIPKYQREYMWGQNQWKDLYDDISENDEGYFIGSIICIDNSSDAYKTRKLEVVDGQQRLTTLCLLLTAIYNQLKKHKDLLDEDDRDEISTLKKSIICQESPNGLRLNPQVQNNNLIDFNYIMYKNKLIEDNTEPKDFNKRKIAKCYNYFLTRLEKELEQSDNIPNTLLYIKRKISKATIVKIEVGSHTEAYTLFESLNNRGMQLTAIDLMKNLILAKSESSKCFDNWQQLLEYLTDDYTIQERFFRQYYNAFKNELNEPFKNNESRNPLGFLATRSNLLSIYEKIINKDLKKFIDDILICGNIYSCLILNNKNKDNEYNQYIDPLTDLNHIQGAPSYLLLMYLFKKETELQLKSDILKNIIQLLTRFFVRRNITDKPSTRDLNTIFMQIISNIEDEKLTGQDIYNHILKELKNKSATLDEFKKELEGDIYEKNSDVTRFILCDIAKQSVTKEFNPDFWEKLENKAYKWTIEHIFPQGKNIPVEWVNMIAEGNRELANKYRDEYTHKLGNLTLTVYNSALSNFSFETKRDRKDKNNNYIGYKNKLDMNKELAEKDKWTIKDITERTDRLLNDFIERYKLEKD